MSAKKQPERAQPSRSDAPTCSLLRDPDDAPKDGTMLLGSFGWPWMVPASWDAASRTWSVAMWNATSLPKLQTITETWWESDSEQDRSLKGWIPFPAIPENV
jgi:hypothetical protein